MLTIELKIIAFENKCKQINQNLCLGIFDSPWFPNLFTCLDTIFFISLSYNFSDVHVSKMIVGRNICWSLYIFNLIYYFQASVSIRSRYSLYIDACVSTTKPSNPIQAGNAEKSRTPPSPSKSASLFLYHIYITILHCL